MSSATQQAPGVDHTTLERALPIIDAAGQVGVPVLLRGGSAIGKSSSLQTLAAARGEHLETVLASVYEPADFAGLPVVGEGHRVHLAPMPWVQRVLTAGESGQPVCVFFDELNTAPPPVQAALLRVLLEGVSGDTVLPERTRFVAAINPTRASTGGWELPAPIASRFLHLDVHVDADDWVTGALSGWSLTPTRVTSQEVDAEQRAAALGRVTAFISAHPHLLHAQPSDPAAAATAWPSPRKWSWAAEVLPRVPDVDDLPATALRGLVGAPAADAYLTWTEQMQLPEPADVLSDPDLLDLEAMPASSVLAVLQGVVALGSTSTHRYEQANAVLGRLVAAELADLAAPVLRAHLAATPAGATKDRTLIAAFAPLLALAGKIG